MSVFGKSLQQEVYETLITKISSGDFPTGENLPPEPKLAEQFNVSRGTIRLVLSALEREGMIARRPGRGTQVVRQTKQAMIASFTQQVKEKGKTPSTRVISMQLIPANDAKGRMLEALESLGSDEKPEQVYCIDRLRYADDQPVAQQTIYLRAVDFGPNLLQAEDFTASLFAIYEKFHRRAAWADEIIQARRPTEEELLRLQMQDLPDCDRLVYIRDRISYDDNNLALEVLVSVERADFFGQYQYRLLADR